MNFNRFADKLPTHGQDIFYIKASVGLDTGTFTTSKTGLHSVGLVGLSDYAFENWFWIDKDEFWSEIDR